VPGSVLPLIVLWIVFLQLPPMWLYLHFLRPMGTAMGSSHEGVAADAACALLFRTFSQPPLLFPPLGQASGATGPFWVRRHKPACCGPCSWLLQVHAERGDVLHGLLAAEELEEEREGHHGIGRT